jgi:plastocyanin
MFDALAQVQGATRMGNNSIGPHADTVLGTLEENTFEQPLVVVVFDQNDNPVQGVLVQWSASGGGSVASATDPTDAGGQSIMEYTFGAVAGGQYRATAAVPGLIGSPVMFELNAHPATPVALEKTNGDNLVVQAGGQVVHSVRVRDSYGNGTQGVTIDWAAATGGGSITPAQNFTGNAGHAEATRTLGTGTGEQTATATAAAITGSPTLTFTTIAANAVVRVANNAFLPNTVTIQRGDSVAWQWQGTTAAHNIMFAATAGKPADEPNRTSGVVWRTFETAGTFNYQCTNHVGMTGAVTVNP